MKSEILKYVISGGIAFACDLMVLIFCKEALGFHYLIANIFGYFSGLLVAYFLNTIWVFTHRKYERTSIEFIIFNTIVLTGLGISEGIMALMVGLGGAHYLSAKILASFFVMIFNYAAKKILLFPTPPEQRHS